MSEAEDLRRAAEGIRARVEAYKRVHPTGHLTTTVRLHVLEILRDLGTPTDTEIVDAYQARVDAKQAPPASPGIVRTARLQLVRSGKAAATGERRPTPRGRTAAEWRATR